MQTIRSQQTSYDTGSDIIERNSTPITPFPVSHRAETMPPSTETVTSSTSAIRFVFSSVSRTEMVLFSLSCTGDEPCSTTTTVSFSLFFSSSVAAVTSGFSELSLPFSCSETFSPCFISSVSFLCVSPASRFSSGPSPDSTACSTG